MKGTLYNKNNNLMLITLAFAHASILNIKNKEYFKSIHQFSKYSQSLNTSP